MAKCTFCNKLIPPGTGLTYARNDGKIFFFDSKKCEKNMLKLRRNPAKTKWVKANKFIAEKTQQ